MKKLITILILSILMIGQAQAQFICKDVWYNAVFPKVKTFYTCREEKYIYDGWLMNK